jgi:1-acyl-sn-glycerol-3-phosphate acyltransferase
MMAAEPAPTSRFGRFEQEALLETVAATLHDLHPGTPGLPEVAPESRLDRDLGFDSLGRMELLLRIETAAGVALPEDTLQSAETVADLWAAVQRGQTRPVAPTPHAAAAVPVRTRAAKDPTPPGATPGQWHAAPTLLAVLDAHLSAHPDRVQINCLTDGEATLISYRQLAARADAVAAGLQRAGLQPRQTVAIMLPTSPDYFYTYLGILRAGGIPVPIYPPARASQLEEHVRRHTGILANAQTKLLVSVPEAMTVARLLQASVRGLHAVLTPAQLAEGGGTPRPVTVRGDDIAFVQYTSGSTGQPKGVALTHANLLANIRAMAQAIEASEDDVFVSWLPLYHDMGLIGAWLGSFYVGFPLVVMSPLAFLARPQRWLEVMSQHGGTLSAGPNFAYELCLTRIPDDALAALDLSRWRLAFNGAEAVSPDTVLRFGQRFAACGLRPHALTPVYGLAEASVGLLFPPLGRGPLIDRVQRDVFERERRAVPAPPQAAAAHPVAAPTHHDGPSRPDDAGVLRFVACGRALPGHEVRIVDEAGRVLPDRVEGRLEFRGPSATSGYWRNPEQTARLFDRGWLDTGDRAYAALGDVFVTGRVKDIVIRGGRNLYPQEIEEAVGAVEGVRKGCVAVFGRADPHSGTERLVVLAEAQPHRLHDQAALRDAVARAVLAAIGEPADEIVLAPPHTVLKTSSGKVRRSACRALVEQGRVGVAAPSARRQWLRLAAAALALRARAALQALGDAVFGLRAVLLFGLLALPVWLATQWQADPARAWTLCGRAARALLKLAGVPLRVQGMDALQSGRPCVMVCNHASYLDGMLLVAALPRACTFVAKRELAGQFIAGRFLTRLGTAFVERLDARRSVLDAQRMAEMAQAGRTLLVFPEGTFRADPGLLPFHLGGFLAAAQAGVPVVPLVLTGTREMLAAGRWLPRRAALAVTALPPVAPPARATTDGLADAQRASAPTAGAGADLFAAAVQMRDAAQSAIARALAALA